MGDPVILTTTNAGFEPIILDFDAAQTKPNTSVGMGNAVLDAVKVSLVNKVTVWKEERFQTFRPLGEFLNKSNISFPKPAEAISRVKQNLIWYQTNYLAVFCLMAIYSALTSPMFLISVILSSGIWIWSLKYRQGTVNVQGFEVPENLLTLLLALITLLIFYLADCIAILLWLTVISAIFSVIHALLLIPLPRDEYGFGVASTHGSEQPHLGVI